VIFYIYRRVVIASLLAFGLTLTQYGEWFALGVLGIALGAALFAFDTETNRA
jgi:hypothetical protein